MHIAVLSPAAEPIGGSACRASPHRNSLVAHGGSSAARKGVSRT